MELITSSRNPHIKLVRSLITSKKARSGTLVVLEGIRSVEDVFSWGIPLKLVLYSEKLLDSDRGQALCQSLGVGGVYQVDHRLLEKTADTETSQGIIAVAELTRPKASDVIGQCRPGDILVIFDELQEPGNVGTILRTAAAFGISAVVPLVGTVDLTNPKVVRASMGAIFHIPIALPLNRGKIRSELERRGYLVLVADPHGDDLREFRLPDNRPAALILGNEGAGVGDDLLRLSDKVLAIPMSQQSESLNVSVAAAVVLYHLKLASRVGD